ncbi:septal ring lytic transglycosylase RlpA family protein [Henriciella sp.]|uniref:septal ring lytic transglycosylase RlpA family protein n=1 Tax=Henriciella sp. TaxID=1968823 RepID=UPI00263A3415|nr:septal ring lytic transglycosylase RlpA family protein [Henriciella sp.]
MARPLASFLPPALLVAIAATTAPNAIAGKKSPAPIEYASYDSNSTRGQGTQTQRRGVPQPNSSASNDAWRGPVTRTGSAKLPETRAKISFSYPGAASPAKQDTMSRQLASVEKSPHAGSSHNAAQLWPARANVPATGKANPLSLNTLTLGADTPEASSLPRTEPLQPLSASIEHEERGLASFYGKAFHGRTTANGEIFDMTAMTAAHRTLPLPSLVQVVNEENGKEVVVRVNDRGPFADNRIIDLSRKAATVLDIVDDGVAPVSVRYLGPAPDLSEGKVQLASADSSMPVSAALQTAQVTAAVDRPNLYGNMFMDGVEPSLGVPDPGANVATPARIETLSEASLKYSDKLAGGVEDDVQSTPLEPVKQQTEPAARTIYAAASPAKNTSKDLSDGFTPGIYVQAGAFSNIGNAQDVHQQIGSGFSVKVEDAVVNGSDFFRVLVGPYPTRAAAEKAKRQLGTRGISESFVTLR